MYIIIYVSKNPEMQTRLNESQPCTPFARTRPISSIHVPDQVRTLSQVGTSSYMAYAIKELTQ